MIFQKLEHKMISRFCPRQIVAAKKIKALSLANYDAPWALLLAKKSMAHTLLTNPIDHQPVCIIILYLSFKI